MSHLEVVILRRDDVKQNIVPAQSTLLYIYSFIVLMHRTYAFLKLINSELIDDWVVS